LVINWFQIRIQHDNENYASSYEIAKGVGVSPSSKFRKILGDMVVKGALDTKPLERSGRWDGRGYMLVSGTYQRVPKQQRTILVKSAKGLSQMELF